MTKCDACGSESDFDDGFIKGRNSFSSSNTTLCPTCWLKRRNQREKTNLIALGIAGGIGFILVWINPSSDFGRFLINVFLFQILLILSIVPHELGHAIAAKLLGWRVFQIVVGVGGTFLKFRMFGIKFEFRWLPIGGVTQMSPTGLKWFRAKLFLTVLAGPAVNFVMACATVVIWRIDLRNFSFDDLVVPRLFLLANVAVLAFNLWPREIKILSSIPSDGKQLIKAFFLKDSAIDEAHAVGFAVEAMMCREAHNTAGMQEWCAKGLALYPEDFHLLNMVGIQFLDQQQYDPGQTHLNNLE